MPFTGIGLETSEGPFQPKPLHDPVQDSSPALQSWAITTASIKHLHTHAAAWALLASVLGGKAGQELKQKPHFRCHGRAL